MLKQSFTIIKMSYSVIIPTNAPRAETSHNLHSFDKRG